MAKSRKVKNQIITELTEKLQKQPFVVISDYKGIPNDQLQNLRDQLKKAGAQLIIVKNTLLKIALAKAKLEIDEEILNKPLMIAISKDIASAKLIAESKEEIPNLEILGGIYEKEYRKKDFIEKLAQIPTKEELLVQLVYQLKAPQYGLIYSLKGNLQKLLYILKEKAQR